MSAACKNNLEQALGRNLSSDEFEKILKELQEAQKTAASKFGKDFDKLPKEQKSILISNELNQNRAKRLTDIETQLLRDKQIVGLSGELKTTLGQSLDNISGEELADNINNLLGNTLTRTSFTKRNGSVITLDTAIKTIVNRLARPLTANDNALLTELQSTVSLGRNVKDLGVEDALMDKILTGNHYDPIWTAINKEREAVGLPPVQPKLDITLSRDDIVALYLNNNKNVEAAAIEFENLVKPWITNTDIDLTLMYKEIYFKRSEVDKVGKPTIDLSALNFKDGKSYMDFTRMFGRDKSLSTHVGSTLNGNANQIALKRVVGDEDVVSTIETKLKTEKDPKIISKLKDSLEAYKELAGLTGRTYDTNIVDLSIDVLRNTIRGLFLGRSAVKGKATDTLTIETALLVRGDVVGAANYLIDSNVMAIKGPDANSFYVGLDELIAGTTHYLNKAGEGVIETTTIRAGLQRSKRFTAGLSSKVQAITGQNAMARGSKEAIAKLTLHKIFNANTLDKGLGDSISALTFSTTKKLGLTSFKDLLDLDINTYNTKLGLKLTDDEFKVAKDKLTFEIEAATVHQVQSLQIDSGGTSVTAQNARLFGNMNNGTRRYALKLIGQFEGYSQNFLLKSQLIRNILNSDSKLEMGMHALLLAGVFILAGYSNLNVNTALKSTRDEPEYADPITDLEAILDGDKKATDRMWKAILSGVSLPGAGKVSDVFGQGAGTRNAPTISYATGLIKAGWVLGWDPTDSKKQADVIRKGLPINLPVAWDAIQGVADAVEEN